MTTPTGKWPGVDGLLSMVTQRTGGDGGGSGRISVVDSSFVGGGRRRGWRLMVVYAHAES